ncbi:unnamed protein product [Absidia cylindrospora]
MTDSFPGRKTWVIALVTSFWTYRKTRNLAVDFFFKTIQRLLMSLPHARRTQMVKSTLNKPTKQARKLLHSTGSPHGSQWNYIAPLESTGVNKSMTVAGHWYIKNIYRHQGHHAYGRGAHAYVEHTLNATSDLVLLYIHGGGFRVGSSTMYSDTYIHWIDRLEKQHDVKTSVLSLHYDLAPEVNWYRMMDQVEQAYLYLLALGVHSSKIIVGGDSAGGFITGMLIPRLKAKGHPMPLGGIMVSPFVTFDRTSISYTKHAAFDCLPESMLQQDMSDLFPELNDKPQDHDVMLWHQQCLAQVSPINADMTHSPPLLVTYGQRERFANDVERYVAHLDKQGVDVQVISRHNEPHVYVVTPMLASSLRAWASDCSRVADWCSQRVKQSNVY